MLSQATHRGPGDDPAEFPDPAGEAARRPSAVSAFTIAEVAMAVIVLALALSTSLSALQRALLNLDTARNLELAGHMLQSEMERERLLPWAQVSDATLVPVLDANFARNPAVAGRFTLSRTLTPLAGRGGQMVQVTLTVRWRSYDGRTLSRSYTSYFTQGGLNAYF
jgi:hypothetical protein